ncbi:glycosyl hydrolases family 18-domain-containing protein [Microdochium trichocladiopsis]|uniref:chitinase n=1 Tax=Microdochium trichocladiopsis TaxID=1682393 RepID=A0A9P9BUP8_9PEZI|nr:glycosyl hydrolases family 18-domain-containing protein [Microdochium trichocladiopsis]KAH7038382.1 glycosyl hydrolases family 18-domain-containing protein [Microdochium trichocladiopsis]
MGPWSRLARSCLLLSTLLTPTFAAVITSRASSSLSPSDAPNVCRAVVSPFDYSAKTRREYELPVCSADSPLYARDGDEVVPASPEAGTSLLGRTELSSLFGRQVVGGDDYTCGPDRPCGNKACCPKKTGQCNYGEEACGTSGISPNEVCWSNCDAKAECGKNAKVPGQKCPLNVCCGKWGFCGMTKDFCEKEDHGATGGCQSNCDQPGPKNKASDQLNRVIGYYEAWRHNSTCQDMGLDDIPVNSLTHLYFSFAFITPNEYNIIGMDGLPAKLFTDFTSLKKKNPGLKTIIAIGGWTHNDPGPLQKVFSNMVSSKETRSLFIKNLLSFLRQHAFDGVDFDWEYPGADDRGGVPEDGVNFTKFLKELDDENKKQPNKYIVSFTAPTSFWYLRHFDMKSVDHVDFVNVMSYDLHGVWDRENPIGSHIYGHTNLTEMSLAFDLFWRNDVPANKLNMGLGFYGRAFQLADPSCNKPGCLFKGGATKGACSGESGILSYREIQEVIKTNKIKPVHDKEAGVKYITWNSDQWVSFDDKDTFKQKKELASKLGLGGYLIWAIDQDDASLSALSAVLDPKPLGDFKSSDKGDENWTGTNEKCYITACGSSCKPGEIKITDQKCDGKKKSELCCPLSGAPDPKECHWRGSETKFCNGYCKDDEVMTHMSKYGGGASCWDGQVAHCCKSALGEKNICKWRGVGEKCHQGELPLTFSGTVLDILDDVAKVILRIVGRAYPLAALTGLLLVEVLDALDLDTKKLYCCPEDEVDKWKNCAWYGKPGNCFDGHCPDMNTVQITDSYFGGGETCGWHDRVRTFCCESDGEPLFLPVPLKNLFEHPPDGGLDTDFTLETDKSSANGDTDPNEAAFQFVVLVSPEELQVSLDKRDGSHWDVFDCNDAVTEGEHTVRMVCTDFTPESNCGKIGLGHGVPGTILQMPKGCGPGKYAVAKSMVPSPGDDHTNLLPRHLSNLAQLKPVVYDLTFDYNFHRVPRDLGNTQMRIDFSNQDDYWKNIVAGSVSRKRDGLTRRTLEDVGGNPVRWLEEEFRDDFHLNPIDKRDLHERWFGKSILEWLAALVKPEIKREFHHKYDDTVTAKLIDETWECKRGDVGYDGHLLAQALLNVKVESSFGFTLIVTSLDLPLDLSQSYLTFYNKGEVTGVVTLEAVARVKYGKKKVIADIPFPGASFKIPGIATIGPQLVVEGSIDARLAVAGTVETKLQIAKWNVRQVVPENSGYKPSLIDNSETDLARTGDFEGIKKPEFYAGVAVSGDIEVKLSAAAEFGIRFDDRWEVEPAGAAVVGEATVTAGLTAGVSSAGTCPFTYELDVGARLFARVTAPDPFGIGWNGAEVTLSEGKKNIFKKGTCPDLGPIPTKRGLDLIQSDSNNNNHSASAAPYGGHLLPALWEGPELVSTHGAHPSSFSKRGGVYGPPIRIPIGNLFCPPAANGDEDDNGQIGCPSLESINEGTIKERSAPLEQRLHSHLDAHRRSHGSGHPHGHHHRRANETDLLAIALDEDDSLAHLFERNINDKDVNICQLPTTKFRYPTDSSIPNANVYGWYDPQTCGSFHWGNPLPSRITGINYHSEHILEAQMIKDFFNYLNGEHGNAFPSPALGSTGDVSLCTYVNAMFAHTVTANIESARSVNGQATLLVIEHIAAQFPTNGWNAHEYVSLQGSINTPIKMNAWADNRIVNTDRWLTVGNANYIFSASGARKAYLKMRDGIALRNYQNDVEVYTVLRAQKRRIGDILDLLDNTVLPANPRPGYKTWQPMQLREQWDFFMKYRFIAMQKRAMEPINNFYNQMKEFWTTDAKKAEYAPAQGDTQAVADRKLQTLQLIEDIETMEVIINGLQPWITPF